MNVPFDGLHPPHSYFIYTCIVYTNYVLSLLMYTINIKFCDQTVYSLCGAVLSRPPASDIHALLSLASLLGNLRPILVQVD